MHLLHYSASFFTVICTSFCIYTMLTMLLIDLAIIFGEVRIVHWGMSTTMNFKYLDFILKAKKTLCIIFCWKSSAKASVIRIRLPRTGSYNEKVSPHHCCPKVGVRGITACGQQSGSPFSCKAKHLKEK